MSIFEAEEAQLQATLARLDELGDKLEQVPRYRGSDFTEQVLEDRREHLRTALHSARQEPYFGRLDFCEWDQETKALYIGKVGVHDEDSGDPFVIDWRAPVASLFYSFTGSEEDVFYQSPEGIVEGEILLKRNIVIRNRRLQRVVDSYAKGQEMSGGDEFLLYKLSEQKDNKLKDIVATIQAEQNAIIRHAIKEPLIIQGAAGSGKTTVALHRLAYLLYEFREQLRAEKMVIFAPNAMFLDYISHVLPELGVGTIAQSTFANWGLSVLGSSYQLYDTKKRLANQFESKLEQQSEDVLAYKGSLACQKQMRRFIDAYVGERVPKKDFCPWDGCVLNKETMKQWIEQDFAASPPMKRRERFHARAKRWIEIEAKRFEDKKEQQAFKSEALKRLRSFLSYWSKPDLAKLYTAFLKEQQLPVPASLKEKRLGYEDIAPLVYMHQQLYGIERDARFDHVVIDEAQDVSPFMLAVLKERTRAGGFTILGDLAQGIHGDEGISNWAAFEEVFANNVSYVQMERSYRSTMEIIEFSNRILQQMAFAPAPAKPVFRSGQDVVVEQRPTEHVAHWVKAMQDKQTQTIAVLTRTEKASTAICRQLQAAGFDAHLLIAGGERYEGGISVLPVYLSKGFEFDAVLLTDVTNDHYPCDELHKKLLYVGCTRALHELTVWYDGSLSPILAP